MVWDLGHPTSSGFAFDRPRSAIWKTPAETQHQKWVYSFFKGGCTISIAGSGNIYMAIEAERVKGIITGSGDLRLSGTAEETYFEVTGSGDIKAKELLSDESSGRITGSGSIDLFAKAEMAAHITGSDDLNCYGHPPLHKTKVTGSGSVHFKD